MISADILPQINTIKHSVISILSKTINLTRADLEDVFQDGVVTAPTTKVVGFHEP